MSASDTEPFLTEKDDGLDFSRDSPDRLESKVSRKSYRREIFIHSILLIFYTTIFVAVIQSMASNSPMPRDKIANLAIQYKPHVQSFTDNRYAGVPSDEADKAWDTLMTTMRIRVSTAELERNDQISVALPDGSGHLAWLGVFHQLHCVRLLRQFIYLDYYVDENTTSDDEYHLKSHADHCLEVLRQGAMCAGDTSLTTFKWDKGKEKPGVDVEGSSVQMCVDWEQLVSSIADRVVGEEEYASLINQL